jgi:hypothetical protein
MKVIPAISGRKSRCQGKCLGVPGAAVVMLVSMVVQESGVSGGFPSSFPHYLNIAFLQGGYFKIWCLNLQHHHYLEIWEFSGTQKAVKFWCAPQDTCGL